MKLEHGKLEINIRDILDSLTLEEKHELAESLIWDKEIFDEFIEKLATDSVVTCSFSSWIYQARLKLKELLPELYRETIRSLLYELDSTKEDAARHRNWAWSMYHAWPDGARNQLPREAQFVSTKFRTTKEVEEELTKRASSEKS